MLLCCVLVTKGLKMQTISCNLALSLPSFPVISLLSDKGINIIKIPKAKSKCVGVCDKIILYANSGNKTNIPSALCPSQFETLSWNNEQGYGCACECKRARLWGKMHPAWAASLYSALHMMCFCFIATGLPIQCSQSRSSCNASYTCQNVLQKSYKKYHTASFIYIAQFIPCV